MRIFQKKQLQKQKKNSDVKNPNEEDRKGRDFFTGEYEKPIHIPYKFFIILLIIISTLVFLIYKIYHYVIS